MEIKSFHIQDSGDPSVGMPATSYELTGPFLFDEPDHLTFFKEDLVKLLDNYGFIQGRATVITDVEHQSRLEAENVVDWVEN